MIDITVVEIKNSLLSSAGFEITITPDDKPSPRQDVAVVFAAIIYNWIKGALFYSFRGNLSSEDISMVR